MMARPWNNKAEAIETASAIAKIYQATGAVPEAMVESINHTIKVSLRTFPGVVRAFYEELARQCPEASKYFS